MSFMATLKSLAEFFDFIRTLYGVFEKNRNEQWFQESRGVFEVLSRPSTPEEKREAAKRLVDLVARL